MFKALNCVMFGAMGAGMGAAFLAEAEKAKIASFDMFTLLDRKSKVDAMAPTGAKGVAIETIDFEVRRATACHMRIRLVALQRRGTVRCRSRGGPRGRGASGSPLFEHKQLRGTAVSARSALWRDRRRGRRVHVSAPP